MTTGEKIAASVWQTILARWAMIATPFFLGLGLLWLDQRFETIGLALEAMDRRAGRLEDARDTAARTLQDHEFRLTNGRALREQLTVSVERRFTQIDASLKELSVSTNALNVTLEKLKTAIEKDNER